MKIGIDVGGSHIGIGLVNEYGEITAKKETDLKIIEIDDNKKAQEKIIDTIKNGINELLKLNSITPKEIKLVGISFPGDVTEKCITKAENLGIVNFNIVDELEKTIKMPVQLRNDAKCAAMAEKAYGSLKKYNDAVFFILGTGIGGAAFIDGKLLTPKKHSGFEFGHTVIEINGQDCNCGGKGCFEMYASMRAFKNNIKKATNIKLHGKELKDYIKENEENEEIKQVIDDYIHYLTIGIANIINILEPEVICIGGSFTHYEDILLEKLENSLKNSKVIYNPETIPNIVLAGLKNDAGIIGATIK